MKFLRRFLPLSMRARLILLVLLTMLAMQATTSYWLSIYRRNHANTVALEMVATTIHAMQNAIEDIPSNERAEFVKRASDSRWRLISGRLPPDAKIQRRSISDLSDSSQETIVNVRRSLRGLINRLKSDLDQKTLIALSHGSTAELFISVKAPPPRFVVANASPRDWLVIPIDQIDPPVHASLMMLWIGTLVFLTFIALWFSWHITRPITQLMRAADEVASGKSVRVTPSGPAETRVLGERFNAMLDALSASESVKRTLLAGLPHDLKGPLARMWLRIEMTDDTELKEGMRRDLQEMQRMTEQFISFLRGTDASTYQFEPIPLDQWIIERVNTWRSAGSDVILIGQPCSAQVLGDSLAFSRLLDNLIDNSLHHGLPPVHVSLSLHDKYAVLRVSDHGSGIPVEKRQEAIEPFVRLDDARTRTGNVGLGLALALMITKAHSGSLKLGQSREGGLEVEIKLPIMALDQKEPDNSTN